MVVNPEPEYPTGPFTIGVGGVVIDGDRVLLVKLNYGHKGWILPGGYVKSTETIGKAVRREVHEETGLEVEPTQIVAARSKTDQGRCDIYVALIVKILGGELKPDRGEVSDLRYFTLNEMESRSDVPRLNTWIVKRAFEKTAPRFSLSEYKPDPRQLYELWF
jgi:ADP-ribose pyrophosphatase YjhB (NUDIX family)